MFEGQLFVEFGVDADELRRLRPVLRSDGDVRGGTEPERHRGRRTR